MVKDTMFIFRMTLGSFVDAPTRRIVSCTIRMLSPISLSRTKRIWERAISFGRKWVIWVINNLVIILFEKLHKCQYSDKEADTVFGMRTIIVEGKLWGMRWSWKKSYAASWASMAIMSQQYERRRLNIHQGPTYCHARCWRQSNGSSQTREDHK